MTTNQAIAMVVPLISLAAAILTGLLAIRIWAKKPEVQSPVEVLAQSVLDREREIAGLRKLVTDNLLEKLKQENSEYSENERASKKAIS
jgi:hypothetical protein